MKYTIFTRKNIYPFFLNVLDKGYILKQGKKEEKQKVARKLLSMNVEIEKIVEATGLSKEEIEAVKYKTTQKEDNLK